jgi:hypothetical protein
MGAFFESALLFSLAVLIVLVGLLIYYFKGRIGELEQKNMKCLELVGEVYKSHLAFKQEVHGLLSSQMPSQMSMSSSAPVSMDIRQDPRIRVEIQEQSDQSDVESDDDDSDDSDSDQSDVEEPQIKMINVDLSGSMDAAEIDDAEEIDLGTEDLDIEEVEIGEVENITVSKMEEIDDGSEITSVVKQDDRESYKKMGLPALRSFIISKGYQTDSAKLQKMKKNELIDLIMESV